MPSRLNRFQRLAFLLAILGFSAGYVALGLLLVLAAATWESIRTRRIPWERGAMDVPFLSFTLAFLISGLVSPFRTTALSAWVLAVLTIYLGYGILHRLIVRDPRFLNSLLGTWAAGGILAAFWAAAVTRGTDIPAFTPALDQNARATALVVAFFMGLWLFFNVRGAYRALVATGLVGILVTLTLTSSRGAWVGFIVGLIAFLTLTSRRDAMRILLLILILGLPTSILTGLHPPLLHRFRSVTSLAANRDRIALADSAIAIFRDHPVLGTGLNTFSLVHLGYRPAYAADLIRHASAHNIFLNMAAEGGTLGGGAFAWVVVAGLLAGFRWVRNVASTEERLAGAAVVSAFLGVLVHQLFDATILAANLGVGFWSLIGIQAARAPTPPLDSLRSPEAARTDTPRRPSVLIVSNGHGEDAVGVALANELAPYTTVVAYPLVGTGNAYQGVRLLDPRKVLPSGGFGFRSNLRGLWSDLRAGVLRLWWHQRATLRGQQGQHSLVIAVGDFYCLWMAAQAGNPVLLIATAKSEYSGRHEWLELLLMRKHAAVVFARDALTAEALRRVGVAAKCVGNPLMDTIQGDEEIQIDRNRPTIVLLPGSRDDARANLALMLHLCKTVASQMPVNIVAALAPSVESQSLRATASSAGWKTDDHVLQLDSTEVRLTRSFGRAIRVADVVVGMAGTASEQAAGLGKPIVAFPGPGPQFTRQFLDLQKRLLGDALVATRNWQDGAEAVLRLLRDPAERARRGAVGRDRMGGSGAVQRIADEILRMLRAG